MLLSSLYLLDKYKGTKRTNSMRSMLKSMRAVSDIALLMQDGADPNPNTLHKRIVECVTAYVDVFYNTSSTERKRYMGLCIDDTLCKNSEPHQNILIMPAFMAELKKPKESVINSIIAELYRKPILFMYNAGKQSMYIDKYIRSMAMDGSSNAITEKIHKVLTDMYKMITELETHSLDPLEHNRKKEEFMLEIYSLKEDNINIFDYMAGKVMPFEYKGNRFIRK